MIPPGFTVHADGTITSPNGFPLKPSPDGGGYLKVGVWSAGRSRTYAVHRLVCEAFHGPRPSPKHQVRHLDGNKLNNNVHNLKWGTAAENREDAVRHGTVKAALTPQQIQEIRERYAAGGVTHKVLAAEYGVSRPYITQLIHRKKS